MDLHLGQADYDQLNRIDFFVHSLNRLVETLTPNIADRLEQLDKVEGFITRGEEQLPPREWISLKV